MPASGKLLRVNLTENRIGFENLGERFYRQYLGGRGLLAYTLYNELPPRIDPLDQQNKLVFAPGLLTGHRLIGAVKCSVGAKSPLTGGFCESEAGGFWGVELKKAGYDGVLIEGASSKPVYLLIDGEQVELRDASSLWGLEVREATDRLLDEIGDKRFKVAAIGPAGERQINIACIMVDYRRSFGRGGMGAVMGSKGLKAIALRGRQTPAAIHPETFVELNRLMKDRYKSSPFEQYGTGGQMREFEAVGNLPVRNHSGGHFPAVEKIDAVTLLETYGTGMEGCYLCPIRCKKKIEVKDAPWEIDPVYGGPEYETLASFGSNLLIDDLRAICKASELCNRYGLDTISTGAAIAFGMECFENNLLGAKETDGLELKFGNAEAMLETVKAIGEQRGLGKILGLGTKKAADIIGQGSADYAIQVKGLEIPYHDPRCKQTLGLHYALHTVGADHCSGVMDNAIEALMGDWSSFENLDDLSKTELNPAKIRAAYELGLFRQMTNYLGLCIFMPWKYDEVMKAVEAVTGWPEPGWRALKAVERGILLTRMFNVREGFTIEEDKLPKRFHEAAPDGPLKDICIDVEAFKQAKKLFYDISGLDEQGIPTVGKLVSLDLERYIQADASG